MITSTNTNAFSGMNYVNGSMSFTEFVNAGPRLDPTELAEHLNEFIAQQGGVVNVSYGASNCPMNGIFRRLGNAIQRIDISLVKEVFCLSGKSTNTLKVDLAFESGVVKFDTFYNAKTYASILEIIEHLLIPLFLYAIPMRAVYLNGDNAEGIDQIDLIYGFLCACESREYIEKLIAPRVVGRYGQLIIEAEKLSKESEKPRETKELRLRNIKLQLFI